MGSGIVEILLLAVALSLDAFAVCVASASSGRVAGRRASLRLSLHAGLFQGLMPILGWFAGRGLAGFVLSWNHWIAFGLLAFVGTRMIREGRSGERGYGGDPSRGWMLITVCVATSIDALAVGLSLALLHRPILLPAAVIAAVTAAVAYFGTGVGRRLGRLFGSRAEIAGGLILWGIGIRILLSHLLR